MIHLTLNATIRRAFIAFRQPLAQLYADMDRAYSAAAGRAGFVCSGCDDNCCRSRFYHHTYLEYGYLLDGVERFEPALRALVRESAARALAEDSAAAIDQRSRPMCPLNLEGRCGPYPYRPMICRLHGIAHLLQRPGLDPFYGPGCETFRRARSVPDDVCLDRTPYYRQMAELELRFKKEAGFHRKLRMTVAEMILSFDGL